MFYKVAVAYGVVAWLLIQVLICSCPATLNLPDWAVTLVIVLIAARVSGRARAGMGVRADSGGDQANGTMRNAAGDDGSARTVVSGCCWSSPALCDWFCFVFQIAPASIGPRPSAQKRR